MTDVSLEILGRFVRGVGYNPDADLRRRRGRDTVDLLRANNVQDGRLVLEGIQHVHRRRVRTDQYLADGDVLICAANGSKHLVGKAAQVKKSGSDPLTFGAFMMVFRPDPGRVVLDYIAQHFHTRSYRNWVELLVSGSSINNLRPADLGALALWLPDPAEQRKVAAALLYADNLIATLERQIAKKQAIKQGLMQRLLTGRARLPQFDQEWKAVRLRDAGSTYAGLTGKTKDDFGTGSATFVTFTEVMSGARLHGTRLERVAVGSAERQSRVRRGDVLFNGSSETPEEVALAAVVDYDPSATTYLNSFCFGYRLKDRHQIDPTYLAHFFRSSQGRDIVSVLAQGATRYNIAKTKLMQVAPVLPPIDEQRAIVEVLTSAEAEITALNFRLAKARAIKTGMMQQLLTGRTRLTLEAAS